MDAVQNAATGVEAVHLRCDIVGATADEELFENGDLAAFCGDGDTFLSPRKVTNRQAHHEVAVTGIATDVFCGELIERDAIAHPFGGILDPVPIDPGEQPGLAGVVAVSQVRDPGEEGEITSVLIEMAEVACVLVVQTGGFGEEEGSVEAEVSSDEEKAFRLCEGGGLCVTRQHGLESWESERDSACAQEVPSMEGGAEVEVRDVHFWRKGRDWTMAWRRLRSPKRLWRAASMICFKSSRSANWRDAPVA